MVISGLTGIRWRSLGAGVLLVAALALPAAAQGPAERTWGVGWDDGLTVRRWLAGHWELAVGAGPKDHLSEIESRSWDQSEPASLHGVLEVPTDNREEQGWVRSQIGYLVAARDDIALVGYSGLVYNWVDTQERSLALDPLVGEYDSWESHRFTERWVLTLGLRPSWHPRDFLSIEFAAGLNFTWESWDLTTERVAAGSSGPDRTRDHGHSRRFEDFGWDGAASLQFFLWF